MNSKHDSHLCSVEDLCTMRLLRSPAMTAAKPVKWPSNF